MIAEPILQNTLKLLAAALNKDEPAALSDPGQWPVDLSKWPEIKKELQEQAVLPLVSDIMTESGLDDGEKLGLMKTAAGNVRSFHQLMQAQTALFRLLEAHDIPAVIMKGAAAAQYYPKPSLRCFGDMDVLVLPEDYRNAFDLLSVSGYKNLQDFDSPYDRHIGFETPEGMSLELHRYFSSSGNKKQNDLLDGWLYAKIKECSKISLEGYPVPVFPALENGLILLGHINQHLGIGLGLRQIIDWMMYVRRELDDRFWETQFREKAEAIGMADLAKTVTRMCQMYLGLSSEITWCAVADESLAEGLMLYIFKKGNLGKKIDRNTQITISTVHYLANPKTRFQYLIKTGMIHMEEAGLKPRKSVAWLYQIGHWLLMVFKRKSGKKLTEEIKTGSEETELLKRLKVTRM